jgi:LacI family transcriptional regulator/LacI family repressor for deo operon, udp, cdd, tsx, nupC, and nupG
MRPKRASTLSDVARLAKVSPGTVSRALAGNVRVSEATRERVLEAAEALRYAPNLAARRLSTGKTLSIAVIVPFFTRPSVSERLDGAARVLAETPYDLIIHNVATPQQRADCFKRFPHRRQVDGVLIISLAPSDDDVPRLQRADVPIVFIDADHPGLTEAHRIIVDDAAGGRLATEHLIALGHTRIGFIGNRIESPFYFHPIRDRYRGYRKAHLDARLPLRPEYLREDEYGLPQAREMAAALLALPEPPTAIFAATDTWAFGVLEAARCAGVRVPEDLSVVGYDDVEMAEVVGLTTVRQHLFLSGKIGMERLLDLLRAPWAAPVPTFLPTELVVRTTTLPPRSAVP